MESRPCIVRQIFFSEDSADQRNSNPLVPPFTGEFGSATVTYRDGFFNVADRSFRLFAGVVGWTKPFSRFGR